MRFPNLSVRREHRVAFTLAICALLAGTDLALTVWQMGSRGLLEANPLARCIATAGPLALIAFKVSMTALHASILLAFRRRWTTECAAWLSVLLLAWPCIQWHFYLHEVQGIANAGWTMQVTCDESLVRWNSL